MLVFVTSLRRFELKDHGLGLIGCVVVEHARARDVRPRGVLERLGAERGSALSLPTNYQPQSAQGSTHLHGHVVEAPARHPHPLPVDVGPLQGGGEGG